MYAATTLDNGLEIVTVRMPQAESLTLGFWVKTGGRYEAKESAGISHFLEHLLFEDTANRTSRQIKEAIEGVGGSLNGFTAEEVTCYLVKILKKHLDLAVDVLSDMLLNAAMTPQAIEKERMVITEEINMYMDLPGHLVLDILNELVWPGHPLGMFLTGTPQTVKSITRQGLIEYKNSYYVPNNIVLACASCLPHERIVRSCKRYFAGQVKEDVGNCLPAPQVKDGFKVNLRAKNTEQTHIAMGVQCVSSLDPDRFAMGLMHVILGANMSSRLFQEIREKRGLAYEISTGLKKYKDTGCFVVSGGIKNDKVRQAIEVILQELKRLKVEPPAGGELKRAKEFLTGQTLMGLEDTMDHMMWAGEQFISYGRIMTVRQILNRINKVTAQDLLKAANKFFKSERLNLAAIGPFGDKDTESIKDVLGVLG